MAAEAGLASSVNTGVSVDDSIWGLAKSQPLPLMRTGTHGRKSRGHPGGGGDGLTVPPLPPPQDRLVRC